MNFIKGQRVICIAEKNEWDPILNDFDKALQIALGNVETPIKGEEYIVNNPMELHYEGKCYISINGFGATPMDERAFKPVISYLFEENKTEDYKLFEKN